MTINLDLEPLLELLAAKVAARIRVPKSEASSAMTPAVPASKIRPTWQST
ncbi:hypothetical protein ACIP5T_00215 [Microbacterium sp. NPDC088619]